MKINWWNAGFFTIVILSIYFSVVYTMEGYSKILVLLFCTLFATILFGRKITNKKKILLIAILTILYIGLITFDFPTTRLITYNYNPDTLSYDLKHSSCNCIGIELEYAAAKYTKDKCIGVATDCYCTIQKAGDKNSQDIGCEYNRGIGTY